MLASDKKKKFFTVRLHYSSDFLPLSDFSSDVLYLKLFFSSFVRIVSETFFTWIWIFFFFFWNCHSRFPVLSPMCLPVRL